VFYPRVFVSAKPGANKITPNIYVINFLRSSTRRLKSHNDCGYPKTAGGETVYSVLDLLYRWRSPADTDGRSRRYLAHWETVGCLLRRRYSPVSFASTHQQSRHRGTARRLTLPRCLLVVPRSAIAYRVYRCSSARSFGRNKRHPTRTEIKAAISTPAAPTSFAVRASGWI
jgi:hypothetical protein